MSTEAPAAPAAAPADASLEASASPSKKQRHGVGDEIACLDDLSDVAIAPFGVSARQIVKMTEVRERASATRGWRREEKRRKRALGQERNNGRINGRDRRVNGGRMTDDNFNLDPDLDFTRPTTTTTGQGRRPPLVPRRALGPRGAPLHLRGLRPGPRPRLGRDDAFDRGPPRRLRRKQVQGSRLQVLPEALFRVAEGPHPGAADGRGTGVDRARSRDP